MEVKGTSRNKVILSLVGKSKYKYLLMILLIFVGLVDVISGRCNNSKFQNIQGKLYHSKP